MKTKSFVLTLVAIVVGATVAGWILENRQASLPVVQPKTTTELKPPAGPATSLAPAIVVPEPTPLPTEPVPQGGNRPQLASTNSSRRPSAPRRGEAPAANYATADLRSMNPADKEIMGRYALSFVGADPAADKVWKALIYDTSLSETVREDLMEDLNENGFSDGNGRVATADDLTLIERRLALLEAQMGDADEFMLTHLGEAYKDLVNMRNDLIR